MGVGSVTPACVLMDVYKSYNNVLKLSVKTCKHDDIYYISHMFRNDLIK